MLLPQSTAFVSLRNRLNAVNSAGFLHIAPKATPNPIASRSKLGRDEIKWQELLNHFRALQSKHEKARRLSASPNTSLTICVDNKKGKQKATPAAPPPAPPPPPPPLALPPPRLMTIDMIEEEEEDFGGLGKWTRQQENYCICAGTRVFGNHW
ncbi:hypothetical protein EV702DRAFT_1215443 [Suillus placidus]|uniref:Uncharacterized protein n=1 Tax=Suillus placidus TaxID=48579 RepID=A0A9P6ZG46_9AGAM|nr:hypothetical protein EV702DRAFT_1215443 [Suillus placidus]